MSFHDLQHERCFNWRREGATFRATEDVNETRRDFKILVGAGAIAALLLVAALVFNQQPTAFEAIAFLAALPLIIVIVYRAGKRTKEPDANRRPWVYEIDFAARRIVAGIATGGPDTALDRRDERSFSQLQAVTLDYKNEADATNQLKLTLQFDAGDQVTLFSFEEFSNVKLVLSDLIRHFRQIAADRQAEALSGLDINTIGIKVI